MTSDERMRSEEDTLFSIQRVNTAETDLFLSIITVVALLHAVVAEDFSADLEKVNRAS